jgi:hypothetical protein
LTCGRQFSYELSSTVTNPPLPSNVPTYRAWRKGHIYSGPRFQDSGLSCMLS